GRMSKEELLARLKDRQQPTPVRQAACKELVDRFAADDGVVQALESVLSDPAVKLEAAQALETLDRKVKLDKVSRGDSLRGHNASVSACAFSADGKWLLTATSEPGKPGEVRLWDVSAAREKLS